MGFIELFEGNKLRARGWGWGRSACYTGTTLPRKFNKCDDLNEFSKSNDLNYTL